MSIDTIFEALRNYNQSCGRKSTNTLIFQWAISTQRDEKVTICLVRKKDLLLLVSCAMDEYGSLEQNIKDEHFSVFSPILPIVLQGNERKMVKSNKSLFRMTLFLKQFNTLCQLDHAFFATLNSPTFYRDKSCEFISNL